MFVFNAMRSRCSSSPQANFFSNREVIYIDTEIFVLKAITCTGGMWMKQGSAGCEFGDVTEMDLFQFRCY